MRPVTLSLPIRIEHSSDVSRPKQVRRENRSMRVRDIKQSEKQNQKRQRVFRIARAQMTPQQRRYYAQQLNSYQLKALCDWYSFSDNLSVDSLNDAQKWILQAAQQSQHLYPKRLRKQIQQYIDGLDLEALMPDQAHPDGEHIQQLLAYDDYLASMLTLLALCRRYYGNKHNQSRKDKDDQTTNPTFKT